MSGGVCRLARILTLRLPARDHVNLCVCPFAVSLTVQWDPAGIPLKCRDTEPVTWARMSKA